MISENSSYIALVMLVFAFTTTAAVQPAPDEVLFFSSQNQKYGMAAASGNRAMTPILDDRKKDEPDSPDAWHNLAMDFLDVQDDEYYRLGYVFVKQQWVPTLFVRRFVMMKAQYEHYLLIKGKPGRDPKTEGITIVTLRDRSERQGPSFALQTKNMGFNYKMPVIPSVSRDQKREDEQQALELASLQIKFFGFEDYVWLEKKEKELQDVADTWQIESSP